MTHDDYIHSIEAAAAAIRALDPMAAKRKILLVLGSGWGRVADTLIRCEGELPYEQIPGFPLSTVSGHAGRLLWGTLNSVPLFCMQGRFHYYEGYSMQQITLPVRVFARLGGSVVFLTNAAGGLHRQWTPGDLMAICDHLNFIGDNPLRGANLDGMGPRFPDMTVAWDPDLRQCLLDAAAATGLALRQGAYLAVAGPNFETPAEIRAFAALGADAVGMSTVPECLVARHCGMHVVGLSCITNLGAGLGTGLLSHEEVGASAATAEANVARLLADSFPRIHKRLKVLMGCSNSVHEIVNCRGVGDH